MARFDPEDPASVFASVQLVVRLCEELKDTQKELRMDLQAVKDSLHGLPYATETTSAARHKRCMEALERESGRVTAMDQKLGDLGNKMVYLVGVDGRNGVLAKVKEHDEAIKAHSLNWAKLMGFLLAGATLGGGTGVALAKALGF